MKEKPRLSAICICSVNDPQLKDVIGRYLQVLSSLPYSCDLTIVGNGTSQEATTDLLPTLQASDIPSRIVSLHRDCDQSIAIGAGLQASEGELVALLPSYLQTDPCELRPMLERIEEGADYVASWRSPRVDAGWSRLISTLFNRATRLLTGTGLHDINSGLRVMRRQLTEHVPIYGDLDRFLPILAAIQGYRVEEVKTKHLEERVKKGDYRLGAYLRRVLDLFTLFFLTKFTRKPLRFFGLIGGITFTAGTVITAILCVQRLLGNIALANRPALIFGVLLIVLGIQVFSLGLLGELIIFTHGKTLRDYHVQSIYTTGGES